MSAVLDLCDRWDALSKGETETTRAIREAYRVDVDAGAQTATVPVCGIRSVTLHATGRGFMFRLDGSDYSQPCVRAKGHGPHHRDVDGNTWTESVR